MAADKAYLIIRGLRTLDTRLKTQENTKLVINFLKKQKNKGDTHPHILEQTINFGKNITLGQQVYFQ